MEAAWLLVISRGTWRIVVESGEKLSSARVTETTIIWKGKSRAHVALDIRDQFTEVLEVLVLNLRASTHHQCSDNDNTILATKIVLFSTIFFEELVTKTGVELLADTGDKIVQVRLVFGGLVVLQPVLSRKHIGLMNHLAQFDFIFVEGMVEFTCDVDITVTFEETITPTAHRSDVGVVRDLGRCEKKLLGMQ
jgi:hypothetical protein